VIRINDYRCRCGNKDATKFFEDSERGELVCQSCGLVGQLQVESKPASASNELLGSVIDLSSLKQSSDEFNGALQRVTHHDFSNYNELKLKQLVDELSIRIGIPQQVSESVIHYHRNHQELFKRFRKRELAVALLYVHMRNYLKPVRSLKEISREAGTDFNLARRYVMKIGFDNGLKPAYRPVGEYVSTLGSRLNVERAVIDRGAKLATHYREVAFSGSAPSTIAACALYLACKENGHKYTQKEIADAFGIATYTIREVSAKMREFMRWHDG